MELHPFFYLEDGNYKAPYPRIAAMYIDRDYKIVIIRQ
jgi:hypothetical protein